MTYYPPSQPQRPPAGGYRRPPMPPQRPPYPQGFQQPQYGPPQQYPPQKPTFSKNVLIALVIAAVIVAGIATVLLINVFNKPDTISTEKVKAEVESLLTDHDMDGQLESIDCPEMTAEKGATYSCAAVIDGSSAKVTVTVQDDNGSVFLEIKGY